MARTIEEVLREQAPRLMKLPGVIGVGEGKINARPCITVFVTDHRPELRSAIPSEIDGHPVEIRPAGEFRALEESDR